jgi:DNA-binding MarR family transcriptional regulator
MTDEDQSKGFVLSRSVSHQLHRIQQRAADAFARVPAEGGAKSAGRKSAKMTLRQFAVLAAIDEREDQTQTDLVNATGIDRSTLADMISRMEKNGWIKRKKAKQDGRAKWVSLTAKGRRKLTEATPAAYAADAALMEALRPRQRETFQQLVDAIVQAFEDEEPGAEAAPLSPTPKAKSVKAKTGAKAAPKAGPKAGSKGARKGSGKAAQATAAPVVRAPTPRKRATTRPAKK